MRRDARTMPPPHPERIAVLLPCHNEAPVIAQVIGAFRTALPRCDIYVYDNDSTDDTAAVATRAGAIVRSEPTRGKGNVVRRMFADVDADIYVLADGDDTYDASLAPTMITQLIAENLDMVVGARVTKDNSQAYRPGHAFGNWFLTTTVSRLFRCRLRDILSGYRVMSRRFVKSFPALARGFEIEAMLTIHTLELRLPYAEMDCPYTERPAGTSSKLNTIRDGVRILGTIGLLFKEAHPFRFFVIPSSLLIGIALALGVPVVLEFIATGLVPRVPTAILSASLMVLAGIGLTCGLILDSVSRGRREIKRLHYLALPSPQQPRPSPFRRDAQRSRNKRPSGDPARSLSR